ncbi:MAG: hypothetical protein KBE16_04990 [Alphaproteobacteria bacterium]|jgi:hypothetical protein|nr:hypothetical protein [Alphaproteobacteria bacterium]MBP9877895.1 hypothetical protein [Alphaproteobacteria bacterium]
MKKSVFLSFVSILFGAHIVFAGGLDDNVATYKNGANEVIKAVVDGKITQQNADQYMAKVNKLIIVGKEIAAEVITQKPEGKKFLEYVVKNGDKAKTESLEEIDAQWHRGDVFKEAGIEHNKFDHYGPIIAAKDAYIQSISSYIALKNYRQSGDSKMLDIVREELEEVVGQLQYVNK